MKPQSSPDEAQDAAGSRSRRNVDRMGAGVVVAALAALVVFGLSTQRIGLLSVATSMLMFLLIVQGWSLLGGYAGYLSLATSGFFGIGAYTTGILAPMVPLHFVVTPLVAMLLGAVLALVLAPSSLRLRGAYFVIFSLIFGLVVQAVVRNADITRGALGIFAPVLPLDSVTTARVWFFTFLVLGSVATALVFVIQRSRLGDALVAVREDEEAAVILGVRANALKYSAFAVGAGFAALAGSIQAYRLSYIEPAGVLSLHLAVNVLIMAVVGGLGRWYGPVLGVTAVMGVQELLRVGVTRLPGELPAESNRLVLGALVALLAVKASSGLAGLLERKRSAKPGV